MRSEKTVSVAEGVLPIRTQPADCEKHGKFDQKVTVILGRELKGGCPECLRAIAIEREESAKAEKAYDLRQCWADAACRPGHGRCPAYLHGHLLAGGEGLAMPDAELRALSAL